jgi:hypothetical protein
MESAKVRGKCTESLIAQKSSMIFQTKTGPSVERVRNSV